MSKKTKTKVDYGIKCPHCKAEPPEGQFEYSEKPVSTQRITFGVNHADQVNIGLCEQEYDCNDAADPKITCRTCWDSFPVPQAFYDAEPWG